MTRFTRCDVCQTEIGPGRNGYRLERLDNLLASPDAHGFWDLCGLVCLTTLAARLTERREVER